MGGSQDYPGTSSANKANPFAFPPPKKSTDSDVDMDPGDRGCDANFNSSHRVRKRETFLVERRKASKTSNDSPTNEHRPFEASSAPRIEDGQTCKKSTECRVLLNIKGMTSTVRRPRGVTKKIKSKTILDSLKVKFDQVLKESTNRSRRQFSQDTNSQVAAAFIDGNAHNVAVRHGCAGLDHIWDEVAIVLLGFHQDTPERIIRAIEGEGPHGATLAVCHNTWRGLVRALEIMEDIGDVTQDTLKPGSWDSKKLFEVVALLEHRSDHAILLKLADAARKIAEHLKPGEPMDLDDANAESKEKLQAKWKQLLLALRDFMVSGAFGEGQDGQVLDHSKVILANKLLEDIKAMIAATDRSVAMDELLKEEDLFIAASKLMPTRDHKYSYVRKEDVIKLEMHISEVREFLLEAKRAKHQEQRRAGLNPLNGMWGHVQFVLRWFKDNAMTAEALADFHAMVDLAMEQASKLQNMLKGAEKEQCVWQKDMIDGFLVQLRRAAPSVEKRFAKLKDLKWKMGVFSRMLA